MNLRDEAMKVEGNIVGLRHECFKLRAETNFLRSVKTETARLRASMADLFYRSSEKILDVPKPSS